MASAGTAAEVAPPPRRLRRDIDHLRALMQQTPATLTGNGIGIVLVGGIFGNLAPRPSLLAWLAVSVALWLTRLLHYQRYRRHPDADDAMLARWRRSWRTLVHRQGSRCGVWRPVALLGPGHAVPRTGTNLHRLHLLHGLGAAAVVAAARSSWPSSAWCCCR
jgi:hypothetical protein